VASELRRTWLVLALALLAILAIAAVTLRSYVADVFPVCRGTLEETEYARILRKADAQADILGDPVPERPTRQLMLAELLDAQNRLAGTP